MLFDHILAEDLSDFFFRCLIYRKDYENRQRLEEEAEQVRKFELEQILRLEKQKKKREDLQR